MSDDDDDDDGNGGGDVFFHPPLRSFRSAKRPPTQSPGVAGVKLGWVILLATKGGLVDSSTLEPASIP